MLKLQIPSDVLLTDLCYGQPLLQLPELTENFPSACLKATPEDLTF